MYSTAPPILVKWLRAAGEPSRLRLLALCADGALSVSDLARALKQSEPRVSRHLKILCEAGLLVRLRHGQWVHYRLAEGAEGATFVRGLLAQLDRSDPMLVRDRSEARAGAEPGAGTHARGAKRARICAAPGLHLPGPSSHESRGPQRHGSRACGGAVRCGAARHLRERRHTGAHAGTRAAPAHARRTAMDLRAL